MGEKLKELQAKLDAFDEELHKTRLKRRNELSNDRDASIKPQIYERWRKEVRLMARLAREIHVEVHAAK